MKKRFLIVLAMLSILPVLFLYSNAETNVTYVMSQQYPIGEEELVNIYQIYPITTPTFPPQPNQPTSIPTDRPVYITNHGQIITLPDEYLGASDNPIEVQPTIPEYLPITPVGIIPPDTRYPVGSSNTTFPYSAVVHYDKTWADTYEAKWCTGSMISPSTVITAAHCVYDAVEHITDPWAVNIIAYPGKDSTSPNPTPYGSCTALEVLVPRQWIEYGQPKEYDNAFIRLNCTIGYDSGIFGFRTYIDSDFTTFLVGYPDDKNSDGTEMWYGLGSMLHSDPLFSYYNNDTLGGNSGSPVWQHAYSYCSNCIMAVHSRYFPDVPENGGPRVAGDFYEFLLYEREFITQQLILPMVIN